MVFNATFNNILVISWQSVLLVEEYPDKTTDPSQITDKLYHIVLYRAPCDHDHNGPSIQPTFIYVFIIY